jgi:hypothetical protein
MRAAAAELGIDVDIRETGRSHDKAIALAKEYSSPHPVSLRRRKTIRRGRKRRSSS